MYLQEMEEIADDRAAVRMFWCAAIFLFSILYRHCVGAAAIIPMVSCPHRSSPPFSSPPFSRGGERIEASSNTDGICRMMRTPSSGRMFFFFFLPFPPIFLQCSPGNVHAGDSVALMIGPEGG